ncbi:hypothetical protein G6O69_17865 [Pseudenhygromyxa sp. WMMC2535]|uniref:hypothetical protein n=1 Tax=Pseudenhygromyxa sp. WMMC2535 TaxID=2712867 RepID=UPI001553C716|nr:hypothetical protein [Pseudenhygromyxa sp. WMMC2535]NVB39715.1 hypothetical protein [Pseudenhygromyxa sp. WMMC2535]
MDLDLGPALLEDPELGSLVQKRLNSQLARYADLLRGISVRQIQGEEEGTGSSRCEVEVHFNSGSTLLISQTGDAERDALIFLLDRVARAVARRVAFDRGC